MNHGKKALSILTLIQLIFFAVVLIAALIIKLIGGPLYSSVQGWYSHAFHDSILADTTLSSSTSSELISGVPLPAPGAVPSTTGENAVPSNAGSVSSPESAVSEESPDSTAASAPMS